MVLFHVHHLVVQLLFILGLCLCVKAYICQIGTEKHEGNACRSVLRYGNPCECTKTIMGGMNTRTPIRPFKPIYADSQLLSEDDLACVDTNIKAPYHTEVLTNASMSTTSKEASTDTKVPNLTEASTSAVAPTPTAASTSAKAPTPSEASTSAEAPTHTEALTSAEAPTPTEASTSAEAPTPSEASTSAEAPTPTEASISAEAPIPSEAPTSAEAPTPTEASTSAEAPTPTEASTSAEAPTPLEASTSAEAPTPSEASTSAEALIPSEASTSAEATTPSEASTSAETPTPSETSTSAEAPTPTETSTSAEAPTSMEVSTRTEASSTTRDKTSYSMSISTIDAPACDEYLGMENGDIPDVNIQASSKVAGRPARRARLNGGLSWAAPQGSSMPWIQADIGYQTNVSGVITQGDGLSAADGADWVTTFKVSTFLSSNEDTETFVSDENGSTLVFSGNTDSYNLTISTFPELTYAQIVRITCLTKARVNYQMRFEVLGCKWKSNKN